MNLALIELAAQQRENAERLLGTRKNARVGAIVTAYALVVMAAIGAAGLLVDTRGGAYALLGSGVGGGALLFAMFGFQDRVKAANHAIDRALDALAPARAMAKDNGLPETQTQALAEKFHTLSAMRSKDILGRQHSIIYRSSSMRRSKGRISH